MHAGARPGLSSLLPVTCYTGPSCVARPTAFWRLTVSCAGLSLWNAQNNVQVRYARGLSRRGNVVMPLAARVPAGPVERSILKPS